MALVSFPGFLDFSQFLRSQRAESRENVGATVEYAVIVIFIIVIIIIVIIIIIIVIIIIITIVTVSLPENGEGEDA